MEQVDVNVCQGISTIMAHVFQAIRIVRISMGIILAISTSQANVVVTLDIFGTLPQQNVFLKMNLVKINMGL